MVQDPDVTMRKYMLKNFGSRRNGRTRNKIIRYSKWNEDQILKIRK